jgi:hypothetical protein
MSMLLTSPPTSCLSYKDGFVEFVYLGWTGQDAKAHMGIGKGALELSFTGQYDHELKRPATLPMLYIVSFM